MGRLLSKQLAHLFFTPVAQLCPTVWNFSMKAIRKPKTPLLKGNSRDIIDANARTLRDNGYSHASAMRCAMCHANKKHDHKAKNVAKKVSSKSPNFVKIK